MQCGTVQLKERVNCRANRSTLMDRLLAAVAAQLAIYSGKVRAPRCEADAHGSNDFLFGEALADRSRDFGPPASQACAPNRRAISVFRYG